jgi:hypothetical protein
MMLPGHVAHTGRTEVVLELVVEAGGSEVVGSVGAANAVVMTQSTVKTAADWPRKVTTRVAGQLNPKVHAVASSQVVVMVCLGVLKAMVVSGGHETVMGLIVAGNESVVTVAPVAVTVVMKGVV